MKNKKIIYSLLLFIIFALSCINVMADDNKKEIETEPAGFPHLVALEANVNVYDYPDIETGKVIYILSLFEDIYASERTIEYIEINGRKGDWVKITFPVFGWVFSAYLGY